MLLSYSKGSINNKTIKVANYLDLTFFDNQKSKFITLNNQAIIDFFNKSNNQINHLVVDLNNQTIKVWRFKNIYIDFNEIESFKEFEFEDLSHFKSIISSIASSN